MEMQTITGCRTVRAEITRIRLEEAAFHAARCGNIAETMRLVRAYPFLVYASDLAGDTLLHLAAARGSEALIDLLVTSGATVNASNVHNELPLHVAVMAGRQAIVDLLIASNADRSMLILD
jgi:ankyrin repeat protein